MAFACKIWLKEECDGCGCCEGDTPMGLLSLRRRPMFDDETYDPLEVDYDDER